jgi:hypothetical protein
MELIGLYRDKAEQLQTLPVMSVLMQTGVKGFESATEGKFPLLGDFVNGILGVLIRALNGDNEAEQQTQALRKIIFAKELGIGKTKLAEILQWRTIPSAEAHAWLWFDLIMKVGQVVETVDPSKPFAHEKVRLRASLPENHPLVDCVRKTFKQGKVNTTQSLAWLIYFNLMREHGIKIPSKDNVKDELKNFIRYREAREKDATGYIQQLKIEGFDYGRIMGEKGLNLTLG